jgi:hypothetical protein
MKGWYRDHWWALLNMVMKHQVQESGGKFLRSQSVCVFWWGTQVDGVSQCTGNYFAILFVYLCGQGNQTLCYNHVQFDFHLIPFFKMAIHFTCSLTYDWNRQLIKGNRGKWCSAVSRNERCLHTKTPKRKWLLACMLEDGININLIKIKYEDLICLELCEDSNELSSSIYALGDNWH